MSVQPWIRTYTKRRINPLDVRPEDVCIEDIEHHLSCINRFVGALEYPISVAQHSICVSRLLGPEWALYGLLHDASEAYLGDVSKWLKGQDCMQGYREAEDRAQKSVYLAFGLQPLDYNDIPYLEWADRLMVRAEGQIGFQVPELIPDNPRYRSLGDDEWRLLHKHVGQRLLSEMPWIQARVYFRSEFDRLTGR